MPFKRTLALKLNVSIKEQNDAKRQISIYRHYEDIGCRDDGGSKKH